jgi:hypothetical protein
MFKEVMHDLWFARISSVDQDPELESLSDWVRTIRSLVQGRIRKLKNCVNSRPKSVFKDQEAVKCLSSYNPNKNFGANMIHQNSNRCIIMRIPSTYDQTLSDLFLIIDYAFLTHCWTGNSLEHIYFVLYFANTTRSFIFVVCCVQCITLTFDNLFLSIFSNIQKDEFYSPK